MPQNKDVLAKEWRRRALSFRAFEPRARLAVYRSKFDQTRNDPAAGLATAVFLLSLLT